VERKLKTRRGPQNYQSLFTYEVYITLIPTLCFQFPEYVCLHSGLSRCSLDHTEREYKRKFGPGEVGYTPPFRISSYAICKADVRPPLVNWPSRGTNDFESFHCIHWESTRMDWAKYQTISIMKLWLRSEFEVKHTVLLHSTSDRPMKVQWLMKCNNSAHVSLLSFNPPNSKEKFEFCIKCIISLYNSVWSGTRVALLVEALCYKTEGRRFDFRWGNWNFQFT
jgi:hypothetical protein